MRFVSASQMNAPSAPDMPPIDPTTRSAPISLSLSPFLCFSLRPFHLVIMLTVCSINFITVVRMGFSMPNQHCGYRVPNGSSFDELLSHVFTAKQNNILLQILLAHASILYPSVRSSPFAPSGSR